MSENNLNNSHNSYKSYECTGLALDPIHVGTGGSRLGRVDNTIIRDPVTKIPKIPGSSLAGVLRAYVAMAEGKYPDCAGQGQPKENGSKGHCGEKNCPVCTTFGFANKNNTGFAGLAGFSDISVLLFPVATREGPLWITAPSALRQVEGLEALNVQDGNSVYRINCTEKDPINLGWLMLPVKEWKALNGNNDDSNISNKLNELSIPEHVKNSIAMVSDKLFSHIINSNLEVRTSVAINPATGSAEDGALFSYEALPRGTILHWTVTCRNPSHFKIGKEKITAASDPDSVFENVKKAFPYLEHLGIGGMGNRGMGRLRVLKPAVLENECKSVASNSLEAGN